LRGNSVTLYSIGTPYGHLCKNGCTDRDAICVEGSDGPMESCVRCAQIPYAKGQLLVKDMHGHARRLSAVSCAKIAEPIDLPFRLWTRMGRRKHKFNCIRQVAPMCPHETAHWRNMTNTIQPSIFGSYVALSQFYILLRVWQAAH